MYTVGELLNNYVNDSSVSKNTLIQILGIDRSSFYQILKGKRLPTSAQLSTILKALAIPSHEKKHISEVYMSEKLGVFEYSNRKAIINLIDTLREGVVADAPQVNDTEGSNRAFNSDTNKDTVNASDAGAADNSDPKTLPLRDRYEINSFIRNSLLDAAGRCSSGNICIHVPIFYLNHIGFFDAVKLACDNEAGSALSYDHIVCYASQKNAFTDDLIHDFTSYISFLMSVNVRFNSYYYYDSTDIKDLKATLFPYYIIYPNGLLLLSNSCDKAVFVRDTELVSIYYEEFNLLKSGLSSIFSNTEDIESIVPYLLPLPDKTKTYYVSYRPGLSYLATDELVEAFLPKELQEMYKIHYKAFKHTDYREFISPEGMMDFMKDGTLSELTISVSARGDHDYSYVIENYMNRLGNNLFLIDNEMLPISDNWSIYCVEHERVSLVPLQKGKRYITITEKNIVEAFTAFFENITDDVILLKNDDVLKLIGIPDSAPVRE